MRSERARLVTSSLLALFVHAALVLLVLSLDEQRMFEPQARVAIELVEVAPAEPPPAVVEAPVEPEPEPPRVEPPKEAPPTRVEPSPEVPPESSPAPPVASESTPPAAPAPPTPALPEGSGSPVRLPAGSSSSFMERVLGRGKDPFGVGLQELEGGLEYKADGPMSDDARAALTAKRMIQDELAEDAVAAGLADDYFRELRTRVTTAWRPAKKELNDGGDHATQLGFLKDLGQNPGTIGELWEAYLDVAKQYARGEKPVIEKKRAERLRELFRSRKGNFRFHAITEVVLTQAADGKVLTLEVPLSSGHPALDEGVRDAFVAAAEVMPMKPPDGLSNGRPFRSTWRLRATWTMVPPTAFLSGGTWDIGPDGLKVDVPFQIKLQTRVMLLTFDNRDHSIRTHP